MENYNPYYVDVMKTGKNDYQVIICKRVPGNDGYVVVRQYMSQMQAYRFALDLANSPARVEDDWNTYQPSFVSLEVK